MQLFLLALFIGSSVGFLFQPTGYVARFRDVVFEYHKSHSLLLIKNNQLKDCYLVRVDSLLEKLFSTKAGRYLVEDDIYHQIQSQTDETKITLPQVTKDFGDYLAKAECRNDVIFELKFTPPKTPTTSMPTTTTTPTPSTTLSPTTLV
ncbi:hypothetical protein LOTGIDRAFT_158610 [Lottia gigantea]|uniref:Uncharacterized protein n=1 Tax=Lottia gigantea TaxID=225164 RepID=V4AQK8_LOTGI|nr:hypothetical protein LOTGIDRAFT_158610 [Lottia gigantea]ESO99522.1 hypothetical protein LOTGIDRAFT_158610 [Lottia gigantea]